MRSPHDEGTSLEPSPSPAPGIGVASQTVSLDIPTFMRSYMYAYGYEQPAKARKNLDYVEIAELPCDNCSTCNVTCASGFDVKKKITDIARLKKVPMEFLA